MSDQNQSEPQIEDLVVSQLVSVSTKTAGPIVIKKWGLRKLLKMGSRVMHLAETIQSTIKSDPKIAESPATMVDVFSILCEDVLEVLSESVHTVNNVTLAKNELLEVLDNLDPTEIVALGKAVYAQNIKKGSLGKAMGDLMEMVPRQPESPSSSSSKP